MTNRQPISRRRLLATAGTAGAVGLAVGGTGGAVGCAAVGHDPAPMTAIGTRTIPFHGTHQAGISDGSQAVGHLTAFDLAPGSGRKEAVALLRRWSTAAGAMTSGRPPGVDDQIALDAGPCSLTVTFGFGASFFPKAGLSDHAPAALVPMPPFPLDALNPQRSNGDLWIQIGADDPLVAFHALRVLQRQAAGAAVLRWQMNGFNRIPGATARPMTLRNLMGQVDGTNNPEPTGRDFDRQIFVADTHGTEAWMNGGSYAVVRRIRMLLNPWEDQSLTEQERVIGRRKSDGSPLSTPAATATETTPVDLTAFNPDGSLAIPSGAHIRVAAASANAGAVIWRRGFSYHDGYLPDGSPDSGLLFIAWQADPTTGFIQIQRKLAGADSLSTFIRHESSAIFAVPGGAQPGEYVGQHLLES